MLFWPYNLNSKLFCWNCASTLGCRSIHLFFNTILVIRFAIPWIFASFRLSALCLYIVSHIYYLFLTTRLKLHFQFVIQFNYSIIITIFQKHSYGDGNSILKRWIWYDDQYLKARKAATPALIHSYSSMFVGNSNIITKFVEWPVVERVPRRETTLYTGQL
jgi:hypothetical protein